MSLNKLINGTQKQYEGADYCLPYDEDEFKLAMLAAKEGNLKKLKKYNGNINDKIEWYGGKFVPEQSLLSIASQYDHLDIVKYLIGCGAKIEDHDEYGSTPLHYASGRGHLDVVALLIKIGSGVNKKAIKPFVRIYGPDTTTTTGTSDTPIHNACHGGHLDVVKYLIDQGAKLHHKNDSDKTPLNYAEPNDWVPQTEGQKQVEAYIKNL